MSELIRDTAFGHIVRFVFGSKYLKYAEEKDPSLWKQFINKEQSGFAAHHGNTEREDCDPEKMDTVDNRDPPSNEKDRENSDTSSGHDIPDKPEDVPKGYNQASGVKIDPEKGRDLNIVDWNGPDDPEVCPLPLLTSSFNH